METPAEFATTILILLALAAGFTVAGRVSRWAEKKGAATTERLFAGGLETPLPPEPPPPKLSFFKETIFNLIGIIAAACVFVYAPEWTGTVSAIEEGWTALVLLLGIASLVFLLVHKLLRKIAGRSVGPTTPPQSGE